MDRAVTEHASDGRPNTQGTGRAPPGWLCAAAVQHIDLRILRQETRYY